MLLTIKKDQYVLLIYLTVVPIYTATASVMEYNHDIIDMKY